MLTGTKQTLQPHPNLLALRAALTAAESVTPARPQRVDVNEQRAAQLIEKMRASYKKPSLFLNLRDIPSPDARVSLHEMELSHA